LSRPPTEGAGLLRESATGSFGSVFGLAAGLALDLTLAFLLGAGAATDALFVALRIPLGVAVFFPPTAVQVLVPAISRWLEELDRREVNLRTSSVLLATFVVSCGLALAGVLVAPLLVRVLAPGLTQDTRELASLLTRVAFIMIPPAATAEVLRAYRHAHRSHGLASALHASVGLTVVAILLASPGEVEVSVVVWAYVAGTAVQLTLGWWAARAQGYRFVPGPILNRDVKDLAGRSLRPVAASAVQLGTRLAEQMVASFMPAGSITILAYANRLVAAVGGTLFFRPITTAFLVPMSRREASKDVEAVRALLRKGLLLMSLVSTSLASVVVLGGAPFVAGLFGAGEFTGEQAVVLGTTVSVYAASLPTAGLQRILLGFTFARLDTTTYLRNTIYGAVVNLALLGSMAIGWRPSLELLVVPIAYSLAQVVNLAHAAAIVRGQLGPTFPGLRAALLRLGAIVVAGTAIMIPLRLWLAPDLLGTPTTLILAGLATAGAGALTFGAGSLLLAPDELRSAPRPRVSRGPFDRAAP
jgi:putative peptidoglycan lipid II flippase